MAAEFTLGPKDVPIVANALSLYEIWLKSQGTLALEHGDVSEDQKWALEKLKELNISPKQVGIQIKSSALRQSVDARERIQNHMSEWTEEEEMSSWLI